nr:MAG TPA: hypothetical protein [Caudoviricetes sp.]
MVERPVRLRPGARSHHRPIGESPCWHRPRS